MKNVEMQNDIRKILSNPSEVQQTTTRLSIRLLTVLYMYTWYLLVPLKWLSLKQNSIIKCDIPACYYSILFTN